MDTFSWIIIGSVVLLIIFGIVMTVIDARRHVHAVELLLNFDNVVKPFRYNEPNEFAKRCLMILNVYGKWTGFRVKESKHGKGWMVEADVRDSIEKHRYFPGYLSYGDPYYPTRYLKTEREAQNYMLDTMEKLCLSTLKEQKEHWDFENDREDK